MAYTLPLPPSSLSSDEVDPDFDFASTKTIYSETKQMDIQSRFRRDADAFYVEAKRSVVSSIAQIPIWMYGVLVVLGWNEAMLVLFNPLYFTLMLVLLVSGYVGLVWKLLLTWVLTTVCILHQLCGPQAGSPWTITANIADRYERGKALLDLTI